MEKRIDKKINSKVTFILLTCIILIGIYPIIRANYRYIDDLARVNEGFAGWQFQSRYLSVFLSWLIHVGTYLTDIAPLPQLLAAMVMTLSSMLIVSSFDDGSVFHNDYKVTSIVAVLALSLSPYFLECFSYRYDSVYMALSVLFSVLPIAFINKKPIIFGAISGISLICMYMTYQASSGIYPLLILFLTVYEWNSGKKISEMKGKMVSAVLSYCVSTIVYKLFFISSAPDYVSTDIANPRRTIDHLLGFYKLVLTDFKPIWIVFVAISIVIYVFSFVASSRQKKMVSVLVAIVSVTFGLIMCFGLYPVLGKTLDEPRAMYGFGMYVALMNVSACKNDKWYLGAFASVLVSWSFFSFAFTYGNALSEQQRYTEFRIQEVIDDIASLDVVKTQDKVELQLLGGIGQSPILRNMPQNFNILNRLVPKSFDEEWTWSQYYFLNYFGLDNIIGTNSVGLELSDMEMISDTLYHSIYVLDNKVIVAIKK